jgi:hypothetical protein
VVVMAMVLLKLTVATAKGCGLSLSFFSSLLFPNKPVE